MMLSKWWKRLTDGPLGLVTAAVLVSLVFLVFVGLGKANAAPAPAAVQADSSCYGEPVGWVSNSCGDAPLSQTERHVYACTGVGGLGALKGGGWYGFGIALTGCLWSWAWIG